MPKWHANLSKANDRVEARVGRRVRRRDPPPERPREVLPMEVTKVLGVLAPDEALLRRDLLEQDLALALPAEHVFF